VNPYGKEILNDLRFGKYFNEEEKSFVVIFKHSICESITERILFQISKSVDGNSK
jgi:hypothetical protein